MAAIVFPANPVVGTATGTFTQGGVTYTYDGTKWNVGIGTPVDLNTVQTITGAKTFGTMTYTGAFTGSTGIINIGAGQIYKDAAGNVGIGTAAPWSMTKLDVTQSTADRPCIIARINSAQTLVGYNYGIMMNNTSATANNYTSLCNVDSTGAGNAWIEFTNVTHSATTPQGAIGFNTRNGGDYTRKMTIDMNGNVGIGTSSPTGKLNIVGDGLVVQPASYTASYAAGIKFRNDGYAHFTVGSKGYAFVISQTSAGTGMWSAPLDVVSIDTAGRVTMPNQPFFMGIPTTDYSTGSMPTGVMAITAQVNNGNCFSGLTNRFTAPVAGYYRTTWGGLQLNGTVTSLYLNGSNIHNGNHFVGTASYINMTQTTIRYLAAGDYLHIYQWLGGGYYSSWYIWTVELIG